MGLGVQGLLDVGVRIHIVRISCIGSVELYYNIPPPRNENASYITPRDVMCRLRFRPSALDLQLGIWSLGDSIQSIKHEV